MDRQATVMLASLSRSGPGGTHPASRPARSMCLASSAISADDASRKSATSNRFVASRRSWQYSQRVSRSSSGASQGSLPYLKWWTWRVLSFRRQTQHFPLVTLENSKPLPLPPWILELLGVLFLWGHFRAWRAVV